MTRNKIFKITIVILVCFASYIGIDVFLSSRPSAPIVLASSFQNGGWFSYGEKTSGYLENHGFTVTNVSSRGSRDNFNQLKDPNSKVNAAIISSSFLEKHETPGLLSLGAVGLEPIWIFYKSTLPTPPQSLTDIAKLSVRLSPKNTGAYAIAKKLFNGVGVNIDNQENFITDIPVNNVDNFLAGKSDVLIFSAGIMEDITRKIIFDPQTEIFNLEHDIHLHERTGLNLVKILKGSISEALNIPPADTQLVTPYIFLIVKKDLSPEAQIALLMSAKSMYIELPYVYTDFRARLPAPFHFSEFELSPVAMRFYKDGPPFLNRYFPNMMRYSFFDLLFD